MNFKKTALAVAVTASLGLGAVATAEATVYTASWDGLFTFLNGSTGAPAVNSSYPYAADPTWGYGLRTPISGTLSFDTSTGAGSATINYFDFFGSGPAVFHDNTLQAIGDGVGGQGTLIAGSFFFDWGGNNNISLGIILDAAGFFGAWPWPYSGTTISGVGALPASDGMKNGTLPIGPAPMATTTWNTDYNVNPGCAMTASCLTSNDTVGGSPMDNGPFPGWNANFDITSIHIEPVIMCLSCPPPPLVPVPAAAWLLGSGLLGLVGVARRKQSR